MLQVIYIIDLYYMFRQMFAKSGRRQQTGTSNVGTFRLEDIVLV